MLWQKATYDIKLRYVKAKEAKLLMEETHVGDHGIDINEHLSSKMIWRLGYYWTKME